MTLRLILLPALAVSFLSFAQDSRIWCTYFGSYGADVASDVTGDPDGYIYLAGSTLSPSGMSHNGHQNTFGGGMNAGDGFLAKFDSTGMRIWSTYFGGAAEDEAFSVVCDPSGNTYICGETTSETAIAFNGFQNTYAGGWDAFLAKFSPEGTLLWSTYFGGPGFDSGSSLDTDADGNIFMAGRTTSSTGINQEGFQPMWGGQEDAFLAKFNPEGELLWSTYYGGFASESNCVVTTDLFGYVYLGGTTLSDNNIASPGSFMETYSGTTDAFLVKFTPDGSRDWGTFFGDYGNDTGYGIITDSHGKCYLAGSTSSQDVLAYNAYDPYGAGTYLVKFSAFGERLFSTYCFLGAGLGISIDADDNLHFAGSTYYPSKFTDDGAYYCATSYGGPNIETSSASYVDAHGRLYVCGGTSSPTGMALNGFQGIYGGSNDAFLTKLTSCHATVSTHELSETPSLAWPNPSENGLFNLLMSEGTVTISDAFGKLVPFVLEKQPDGCRIDLSASADGMYFINVSTAEGRYCLTAVKQH